jgi:hypothetical protein
LVKRGSRLPASLILAGSHRLSSCYGLIRSRLAAFMSFRGAERLIGDLFYQATGQFDSTKHERVVSQARLFCLNTQKATTNCHSTKAVDLYIEATFVRICSETSVAIWA